MSVRRRVNLISQQRIETPNIKSIESAVSSDFDELLATFLIGIGKTYVVRGFEATWPGTINGPASGMSVIVSDSAILHGASETSGTFYAVAAGAPVEFLDASSNSKVSGTFASNTINYVSLDFERSPDSATSGAVTIRDVVAKTEVTRNLPLAQVLKYKFFINTGGFPSGKAPLFTVETNSSGNVVAVTDQRELLNRQGKAGASTPDILYKYPWTEGRVENSYTSNSPGVNPFRGGDKQIKTLKDWMDAVTTSIQEVKGTPFWYSVNTGGSSAKLREDAINVVISGRGNVSHHSATSGRVNWSHDFFIKNVSSRASYKIASNVATADITLSDGDVAYLNLVRGVSVPVNLVFTQGSPNVSSAGLTGWTTDIGLLPGDFLKIAGESDNKYYQVATVVNDAEVVLSTNYTEASTPITGVQSQYSFGSYNTSSSPSTSRHIYIAQRELVPSNEDMFWLFFRDDNGGSVPKIYTRMKAGEIEKGESIEISDNTSEQLLQYVGSTGESDSSPVYTSTTVVTNGDSLTTAVGKLDADSDALWSAIGSGGGNTNQDRSLKLIEGGTWSVVELSGGGPGVSIASQPNGFYGQYLAMDDSHVYSQGFIAGASASLNMVKLQVSNIYMLRTGTMVVHIYSDNAGEPNALLETSDPVDVTTLNYGGTAPYPLTDFVFQTPVAVTSGTKYHIVIDGAGMGGSNYIGIASENNAYAGGDAQSSTNPPTTWGSYSNWAIAFEAEEVSSTPVLDLTWSASAFVQIPGIDNDRNEIVADTISLPNLNSVAYVNIARAVPGVSGNLTVVVGDIDGFVPTANTVVIARRVSDGIIVGTSSFLLKDGESLEIDGALAEINRYFGQLRLKPHDTIGDRVVITGADIGMLSGVSLGQSLKSLLLDFDGAEIDFTTGNVYKADGSTPLGTNFTPISLSASQWGWYSVTLVADQVQANGTITAKARVLAGTGNASKDAAPRPKFSSGISLGMISVQKKSDNSGLEDIGNTNIVQLGVGGGGGTSSSIDSFAISNDQNTPADVDGLVVSNSDSEAWKVGYSILRSRNGKYGEDIDPVLTATVAADTNGNVKGIVKHKDGYLVYGDFSSYGGVTPLHCLARLNADGSLDSAFCSNSSASLNKFKHPIAGGNGVINSVCVLANNSIIVGGMFDWDDGVNSARHLMQIKEDGTNDAAFTTNMSKFTGTPQYGVYSVDVDSQGFITFCGTFNEYNSLSGIRNFARCNPGGGPDNTFMNNATYNHHFETPPVFVTTDSNDKVYVGGTFLDWDSVADTEYLVRFNTNGTRDATFSPDSIAPVSFIKIDSDDNVLTTEGSGSVKRRDSSGAIDSSFQSNLPTFTGEAKGISIGEGGKLYISGTMNFGVGQNIMRLSDSGVIDAEWSQNAGVTNNEVYQSLPEEDGGVIIIGLFTNYKSTGYDCFAKLLPDTPPTYLNEAGDFHLMYDGSDWDITGHTSTGDNAGVDFTVTSGGQVQYTSSDIPGGTITNNRIKYSITEK